MGLAAGCEWWVPPGDGFEAPGIPLDGAPKRVLFLTWEDTPRAMRRILHHAGQALGIDDVRAAVEDRMVVYSVPALGPVWAPSEGSRHTSNLASLTAAGRWLCEQMHEFDLVIADPLAAMFNSNENDRGLVRAYLTTLDNACQVGKCAMMNLAHSSKDYLVSGSTDWKNGVRTLLALEVVVEKKKPQGWKQGDGAWPERRVGIRLRADKMNEAELPAPRWLAHGPGKHRGWISAPDPRDQR